MLKINRISNDTLQQHSIFIPETGISCNMILYFMPMQYSWVLRELSYEDFSLKNIRVVNSYNMLHQFRNQLPFGLSCLSKGDREPTFIEDFQSEYSILRILESSEVDYYTKVVNRG